MGPFSETKMVNTASRESMEADESQDSDITDIVNKTQTLLTDSTKRNTDEYSSSQEGPADPLLVPLPPSPIPLDSVNVRQSFQDLMAEEASGNYFVSNKFDVPGNPGVFINDLGEYGVVCTKTLS